MALNGVSLLVTLVPKDASGQPEQSARVADSMYVLYRISNDLPTAPITLTFPGAKLFDLEIVRADGTSIPASKPPAPVDDYVVTLRAGQAFVMPIMPVPDPLIVPTQTPLIELAEICSDNGIPDTEPLKVRLTIPLAEGEHVLEIPLWAL